jgi:hypothetical protein
MKVKVTHKGIRYATGKDGERPLEVGEIIEIKEDKLPKAFINKVTVLGEKSKDAKPVTNEEKK